MDCFGRTQQAKNKTEEAQAREKLELVLLDLQTDKAVDPAYNENEYIDEKIKQNGMIVSGDIVFVNGYQFQLDRNVPKIGVSIGKGEEDSQIEITMTSTTSSDFVKATIHIEIEYQQDIKTMIFDGENIEIPEKKDGKYVIDKEVYSNGTYSVIAKNSEDKYNIKSITITDISEDINIYTAEDLAAFRDKVNSGATFEGKTIKVMNNLDLKDVCGAEIGNWEPIGNETTPFKGTFDGKGKNINNIYINSLESDKGLFGTNNGTIQNVNISNSNIIGINIVGGICAYNYGTISYCKNEGSIKGICYGRYSTTSKEYKYPNISGIVASNYGTIEKCYNNGILEIDLGNNTNVNSYVGGICAENNSNGVIKECYNIKNLTANSTRDSVLGGICSSNEGNIFNCYNIGDLSISASVDRYCGGIVGYNRENATIENSYNVGKISGENSGGIAYNKGKVINSYYINTCGATGQGTSKTKEEFENLANMLGESYINDEKNEDEEWKYNNGYPILKWQLEIK